LLELSKALINRCTLPVRKTVHENNIASLGDGLIRRIHPHCPGIRSSDGDVGLLISKLNHAFNIYTLVHQYSTPNLM
jgi:hypothetical protein